MSDFSFYSTQMEMRTVCEHCAIDPRSTLGDLRPLAALCAFWSINSQIAAGLFYFPSSSCSRIRRTRRKSNSRTQSYLHDLDSTMYSDTSGKSYPPRCHGRGCSTQQEMKV